MKCKLASLDHLHFLRDFKRRSVLLFLYFEIHYLITVLFYCKNNRVVYATKIFNNGSRRRGKEKRE